MEDLERAGGVYAVMAELAKANLLDTSIIFGRLQSGAGFTENEARVLKGIYDKALTLYNLPSTPTMQVDHPQRTFVNLRAAPSMLTGAVLTRIPHNAVVTVLSPSSNGWVKVHYNGFTGYAVDYFLN